MTIRFAAPWSSTLTFISVVLTVALLAAVFEGAVVATAILAATFVGAAAFAVRGYAVEPGTLVIERLGWQTRIDLAGLVSAEANPDAMRWAFRTWGIGGPFAFVGHYRSRAVGAFTAYATDRDRAVVLRWPDRAVVVTPDDPETFVTAVEAAADREF